MDVSKVTSSLLCLVLFSLVVLNHVEAAKSIGKGLLGHKKNVTRNDRNSLKGVHKKNITTHSFGHKNLTHTHLKLANEIKHTINVQPLNQTNGKPDVAPKVNGTKPSHKSSGGKPRLHVNGTKGLRVKGTKGAGKSGGAKVNLPINGTKSTHKSAGTKNAQKSGGGKVTLRLNSTTSVHKSGNGKVSLRANGTKAEKKRH